jgi:stage III sporulation protein AF
MSDFLGSWIKALAAAAIFASVMLAVTPKGAVRQTVKLICGALLTFALLSPLKSLNFDKLAEFISKARLDGREIAASSEKEAALLMKLIIEEETEAYILDKAEALGISGLQVEVSVKEGGQYPYPYSAKIACGASREQKSELSSLIEGELGIPADRQLWSYPQEKTVAPDNSG